MKLLSGTALLLVAAVLQHAATTPVGSASSGVIIREPSAVSLEARMHPGTRKPRKPKNRGHPTEVNPDHIGMGNMKNEAFGTIRKPEEYEADGKTRYNRGKAIASMPDHVDATTTTDTNAVSVNRDTTQHSVFFKALGNEASPYTKTNEDPAPRDHFRHEDEYIAFNQESLGVPFDKFEQKMVGAHVANTDETVAQHGGTKQSIIDNAFSPDGRIIVLNGMFTAHDVLPRGTATKTPANELTFQLWESVLAKTGGRTENLEVIFLHNVINRGTRKIVADAYSAAGLEPGDVAEWALNESDANDPDNAVFYQLMGSDLLGFSGTMDQHSNAIGKKKVKKFVTNPYKLEGGYNILVIGIVLEGPPPSDDAASSS